MNVEHNPKDAKGGRLDGLLAISGFMLMVSAFPVGLATTLQTHFEHQWEWKWAGALGVSLMLATAVIGGGLYRLVRRKTRPDE